MCQSCAFMEIQPPPCHPSNVHKISPNSSGGRESSVLLRTYRVPDAVKVGLVWADIRLFNEYIHSNLNKRRGREGFVLK